MTTATKIIIALATVLGIAQPAAAAETVSYPIPWNISARNCAVLTEYGPEGTTVIIRCKGQIDIAAAFIPARRP
jgi:hypothetical protein